MAQDWFEQFEGAGLDGVVAKPLTGNYLPDKRTMFKIKHTRTADCVVAGYRVHKSGPDSIGSLLRQDYAGRWAVVLVDDDSADGTAEIARNAANAEARLHVVRSRGLPAGWTGKLWALKQGIDAAMTAQEPGTGATGGEAKYRTCGSLGAHAHAHAHSAGCRV